MEQESIVILRETNYEIEDVTYEYNEEDVDYTFCLTAHVVIPKYPGVLNATFSIDYVLDLAEKRNPGMVKYIKATIEGFKEQSFWDRLAFEALEEEGFDLKQLMRYPLNELELRLTRQD